MECPKCNGTMRRMVNGYWCPKCGKIWETLDEYGPLIETKLMKHTRLTQNRFYAAVGWLARENKICKNDTVYELGETNLTNKIGEE